MGFSLEIKTLMVNIVYENKNFLKGNFPRNSQLRPKKKITKKKMEALTVRGTQIKRIETKNPLHKHKFQL